MSITGKALKVDKIEVESDCGYKGLVGISSSAVKHGADAFISFMPCTAKVNTIKTMLVGGNNAIVLKVVASLYISGMYTFFIKYEE